MDDSTSKQLIIEYDTTVITNEDLFNQIFTLEESLCSEEELRFGSCEASVLKFKVANIVAPMINKWLSVKMVLNNHAEEPFIIGRYKVAEDKLTADKQWREITAYDAMYDIINADMAAWYNSVFPDSSQSIPLEQFRNSFMFFFNLEQVVPKGGLVNDRINIEKTIQPEQISGKDIITAICEINGCFGHIGRDGKFHYIYLPQAIQGLYPANDLYPDHAPDYLPWQQRTGHLYPQTPKSAKTGADGTYISCQYEDYTVKTIDKLQIRQEENDIGAIVGRTGDNCYIIEDNFLVYGKSSNELMQIANKIFDKITDIVYRPIVNAEVKGNPCFEVGDPIRITTKYELVETYILERTLEGIQGLRDAYVSNGVENYTEQVNGIHKSIIQLKGKTNTIKRTVDENRQEMLDIEAGLSFTIVETAKGLQADIEAEQQRAEGEESKLSTKIELTAEGLQANIDKEVKRAGEAEEQLSTDLQLTAEGLQLDIDAEVKRAGEAEEQLSTDIEALAGKIVLKVKANGKMALVKLSADPEEGTEFQVKADNIYLTAAQAMKLLSGGTLDITALDINIKSTNWSADKNGNAKFNNIECNNIKAFSISTEAKNDFNSEVNDSEAMKLAQQAITNAANAAADAAEAAKTANQAIGDINVHIKNINDSIDKINAWILQLSNQIKELGKPGIS